MNSFEAFFISSAFFIDVSKKFSSLLLAFIWENRSKVSFILFWKASIVAFSSFLSSPVFLAILLDIIAIVGWVKSIINPKTKSIFIITKPTAKRVKEEVISLLETFTIKLSRVFTSVIKFADIFPLPKLSYSFIFTFFRWFRSFTLMSNITIFDIFVNIFVFITPKIKWKARKQITTAVTIAT